MLVNSNAMVKQQDHIRTTHRAHFPVASFQHVGNVMYRLSLPYTAVCFPDIWSPLMTALCRPSSRAGYYSLGTICTYSTYSKEMEFQNPIVVGRIQVKGNTFSTGICG